VIGGYRSVVVLTFPYPITGDNSFSAIVLSAIFHNLFGVRSMALGISAPILLNNLKKVNKKTRAENLFLTPGIRFFKIRYKTFVKGIKVLCPAVFKAQLKKKINSFKIFLF